MNIRYSFNVNLSVFYLSAVEELCFAFCCTCEQILCRAMSWDCEGGTFSKTRVTGLHTTSLACVVLLDYLMLFILLGVKIKESFSII